MVDRKTDNNLYCGFPIATPSFAEKMQTSLLDAADDAVRKVKKSGVYVPFVSDTLNELHLEALDANPVVQEANEDLNSLIEQALAYSGNHPPVFLRFVDRSSRQWIGTPIIGSQLQPHYQIDLREREARVVGHPTFKDVCLDYPTNLIDSQGLLCLFSPWGYICRNPEMRKEAQDLLLQGNYVTNALSKQEIMENDTRLYNFFSRIFPNRYNPADWNVSSYRLKLFKFAGNTLLERDIIPDDAFEVDLYPEEVEQTGGNKFRLYTEGFSSDDELRLNVSLMNEHLKLYHLHSGSSEGERVLAPKLKLALNPA
jgi:hypothetical protein